LAISNCLVAKLDPFEPGIQFFKQKLEGIAYHLRLTLCGLEAVADSEDEYLTLNIIYLKLPKSKFIV